MKPVLCYVHVLVIRLDAVFFLLPAHTNHHTSATFKLTVSTHFSHIHVEHICGYILQHQVYL